MEDLHEAVLKTAEMLRQSRKTLALTGAGASTGSGIPDYRSKGTGLWEKYNPMQRASVTALLNNPAEFYSFSLLRWASYLEAEPNAVHRSLALLEKSGLIYGVITQNIDGLHRKAGSLKVWEVHGHLRSCHCLQCAQQYPFAELTEQYNRGINPPRCQVCQGILRPDVVLFEDPMGEDYYRAVDEAVNCDLMLVVGSSLQVYPVADLPRLARQLIIVNREPTPWDQRAVVVVHAQAEKFLGDLVHHLGLSE